ncbi:MAG: cytochrome P450 [Planctomycetota bacterium]
MTLPLPPGPRGYPIVGVLPRIWRDPLRFFEQVGHEHGPVARVGLGKFTLYLLTQPAPIQRVLQDNAQNYWKGAGLAAAEPVMGKGLATSEGELWRRQRKLVQPAFARKRMSELLPAMQAATEGLIARWADAARRGEAVEAVADTSALTQELIFRCLFGGDLGAAQAELGEALLEANAYINAAAWSFFPLPERVPTPRRVRFRRALATLDRLVYGLIATRRARGPSASAPDLLDRLLAASDEGGGMSDRQARDEVMTLFVAGHDTTAGALAWTLLLLAQHPEQARRVREEADAVLGEAPPDAHDLARLEHTERVVRESMRVYPPAWVIVRTPFADDELGGYRVPKDAPVLISQYVVHRHPDVWPDPLRFDPERWLPERAESRPRFAYFPYGAGQRLCVGKPFADAALLLVIARLLQRFELALVGAAPRARPLTTLRPGGPLRLRLTPRR